MPPDELTRIRRRLSMLEMKWSALEDRVAVLEENTSSWDCRIEDLETWQEEVKDTLDEEYE